MSKFDFSGRLNFDKIDLTPPNRIVGFISNELCRATRGIIVIGIEPYEGIITQQQPSFATTFANLFQKASASYSVLPEMGKLGEEIHQYELFLFTPSYPNYRFRMMFLRYGVASYPAEVILEQGVAIASSDNIGEADLVVRVDSRDQLETLIEKILTTDYIVDVMQELIRVDQMQKYRSYNALEPIPEPTKELYEE